MKKGQLFVLSGPSGSGKDTVLEKVLEKMNGEGVLSVSMTTRAMRSGEEEGVNYYFVSVEEFENNIKKDHMLEYAKYGDNYYGTPAQPIRKLTQEGKTVFLNIEVQGGANIRRLIPSVTEIFIMPPSMAELERRLCKRGTESEEDIKTRMSIAKEEITHAVDYDYIVVNDDLETAVDDVMSIVRADRLVTDKMKYIISEVIDNA